jgi:hypothetical protein
VQEGIVHIQLMNGPAPGEGERQNSTNCSWFDNMAKCLIIVNAWSLGESTTYPASLVSPKRSICVELVFEVPLASNDVDTGGRGTKSQVWLDMSAEYSSSIARRQCGSGRPWWNEDGLGEMCVAEWRAGIRKPSLANVVIRWGLTTGVTRAALGGRDG